MNDEQMNGDTVGQRLSLGNLFKWAGRLFKEPRGFFSAMAKTGGYGVPVLYALFWFFASTLAELAIGRFRPQPIQLGVAVEVGWLFLGPLVLLAFGFIVSGVLFVIWHLMGSKENYQTAFRCWAFTTPVAVVGAVLGILPYLNILAMVYATFLIVIASIVAHGIPPKRSWAVWGTLCGLMLVLVAVSVVGRQRLERRRDAFPRLEPPVEDVSDAEEGLPALGGEVPSEEQSGEPAAAPKK